MRDPAGLFSGDPPVRHRQRRHRDVGGILARPVAALKASRLSTRGRTVRSPSPLSRDSHPKRGPMTERANGSVPIIGRKMKGGPSGFTVMMRKLDENGQYDPLQMLQGPGGIPVAPAARPAYVDATHPLHIIP